MSFQPSLPLDVTPAPMPAHLMHGSRSKVHSFRDSLALSEEHSDSGWWLDIYRQAFPTLRTAISVRDDGWAQRGGIDRVITLACGRVFTVDEKVRTNDWPDILLERWSDERLRSPGWIQKPLACDFIAYAFASSGRCYLLPVVPLQRAWRLNGRRWAHAFGERRAQNLGYVSANVPVPIDILMQAMGDAMVLHS